MKNQDYLQMELRTSPHASRGVGVVEIMRTVVWSLLPLVFLAYWVFGLSALVLVGATTLACVAAEALACRWSGRESTTGDYSAIITGLLLGLTLPPGFPVWMGVAGGVISIILGKEIFGGLGFNVFNPALVGRAFLQAAFPAAITTWTAPAPGERLFTLISTTLTLPFTKPVPDGITGATPLAAAKWDNQPAQLLDMFLGYYDSGSLGETSALLILVCAAYLAWRRMLDWRIPAGIFVAVFVCSGALNWYNPDYEGPLYMFCSGGLMLGACFMATDMVTSPVTSLGTWLYALIIGALIVVIRLFGGLPEGVMYAILLGNALTPVLHVVTQPRVYGTRNRLGAK